MAYDSSKDPFYNKGGINIARSAAAIAKSDDTDLDQYAIPYCIAAGTIKFTPVGNDDADPISMTVPVGWQCPWQIKRLWDTGTGGTFRDISKIY